MSQDLQEPRKGTQVVHVRENSGNELDALFSVAMNPQQQNAGGQVPLRMRKFPASFWNPPEPHRHVKQGSNDSTGYPGNIQPGGNLPQIHMRTQSSPATLGTGLSAAPPPQPQPQHARQHSCDALLDSEPLPPGWEMAKTQDGQRYYLNHDLQLTTWQDPRKTLSNNALNTAHRTPPNSQSPNVSIQNLGQGPLPPGWEQACTPEGDVYYINHVERTTSWYDPRIPEKLQQLRINTNPQTGQVQRQMTGGQMPPAMANRGPGPSLPVSSTSPVSIQFSKLQLEKERLRKRQEDLQRQEMILRAQIQGENPPTSQSMGPNELTTVTDPFLGQSQSGNHIKQESGDSGVGGMGSGNSYTLSRTPEDFLSNVSEMEQDPAHRQGEFNNMDIGNIGGNEETSNMDSEDLVPSLQEDISSELLNDMENVLNSNKLDNMLTENLLTWL